MAAEDLQLNCGIRNVLNRHSIDLTKTSFYARRGHVHLSGKLDVVGPCRGPEDTVSTLKAFESELRRLREVKTISFDFTNWVRDDTGVWIYLEEDTPSLVDQPEQTNGSGIADLSVGRRNV